jgi:pimeloyl-ACP methyl ester carboxylesterase
MRRGVLVAAVLLAGCSRPAAGTRFVEAPCAFRIPAGAQVRCGWLSVPEDRSKAGGRRVRLHVAIYKSRSAQPAPDPILWLTGGPGGRGHVLSSNLFDRVVAPFLGRRDFIVLDVRGTGYSQPALDCRGEAVEQCRERLSSSADLSCYNSAAVAADLAELRRALGFREWNLLGESYGTRLALIALRDHPEGIRSVILDSVAPPEVDEYADGPAKFEGALEALSRGSDLRAALLAAADKLDRAPRSISGTWRGRPFEFELDGRQLMNIVRMALYESDLIPQLPQAIRGAMDGSGDEVWREAFARHAIAVATALVDHGAYLSFHCSEEIPFSDIARLREEDARRPWMRHVSSGLRIAEACRAWGVRRGAPGEALPVRSDIPVLLLAGEYDPVTPPRYAESAARYLRKSHLFVLPRTGHWVTANPVDGCAQRLALEFLERPGDRPKADCAP